MDAHLFRLFAERAAVFLNGAMIEKIREPRPGLLDISMYGQGMKRTLLFRYGKQNPFCFFSSRSLPASGHPSAPVMRVRKYFAQKRIASAVFQYWQRKLWLMGMSQGNESGKSVWLCLDLANGFSLHFLDHENAPQTDAEKWPDAANLDEALENWRPYPMLTPLLRKTLKVMDKPDRLALLTDLEAGGGDLFVYRKGREGAITAASAWPLCVKPGAVEETREDILPAFEDIGNALALASVYRPQESQIAEQAKRKMRQLEKLLQNLEKDGQKLLALASQGDLANKLRDNLWSLDKDAHASEIALPDGCVIALDKRYSVLENMERMFKAAARGKRGLQILKERRSLLARDLAEYKDGASIAGPAAESLAKMSVKALSRHTPGNVAVFRSSDGFVILRGKDAKGNMAARKMAQLYDLWAHVEKGHGAHVIIRKSWPGQEVPERTLLEAGSLAAIRSWLRDAGQASIMFAEVRHVKPLRKGAPGNVTIDRLAFTRMVPIWQDAEIALGEQPAKAEDNRGEKDG